MVRSEGKKFIVFCVVFSLAFLGVHTAGFTTKIGPRPLWNETFTDKLRKDLLLNYDKFARPAQHTNTTTTTLGLEVRHIEVNEFKSTITVFAWAKLTWNDEKLKWNASDYGGITHVNIADHEIWQPDIFLYNSPVSTAVSHYNTHCLVYSTGEILWVPPTQFTVLCNFNLKYWPFDSQHCELFFGSWTHHGSQIDIVLSNQNAIGLDLYVNGTEWAVTGTHALRENKYYNCCAEPYPYVLFTIDLQRVSPSYKSLIVTPTFVIIILTLLSFWLPPQSGEKILLNGVTTLIITLFMLYFTQKIPAMGTHTPLIVLFYSSSLYVICFSLINSVVVIWMSRTQHLQPVPWVIKDPLMGCVGKWLGLANYIKQATIEMQKVTAEEMRDHQVTSDFEEHSSDDKHFIQSKLTAPHQGDWILLAAAIDRISFIFYSVLFMILAASYAI